jgi:RHS repeat-associated protein
MITNTTAKNAGTASYTAYGTRTTSPFGYAGQYTDTETGLQWDRARYYDPTTAQFLTVDPLAAATGSAYGYAGGNPLNASDPSGLITKAFCLTGSAGYWLGGFSQVCMVAGIDDRNGRISIGTSETFGGPIQTPSASVQLAEMDSTARNVQQTGGPFWYGGISGTLVGPTMGAGLFEGTNCDAPGGVVNGIESSVGLGAGTEVHGGRSFTDTQTIANFTPLRLLLFLTGK